MTPAILARAAALLLLTGAAIGAQAARPENDLVLADVLLPAAQERGHILRALAGQLAQRTAPEKQTHGERKRIRALLFAAAEADKTGAAAPLP